MSSIYEDLRQIAAAFLRREGPGHLLQTTALAHEAYLRLAQAGHGPWGSRAEFCAAAAQAIRRVLIDHARARRRVKRGGPDAHRIDFDTSMLTSATPRADLLELDEALNRLAVLSQRQARVVELRYFGGLSEDETADVLGVSRRTVQKDWRGARAWLQRALAGGAGPAAAHETSP